MALSTASPAARRRVGGGRSASTVEPSAAARTHAGRRPARRWLTAVMLFVAAALAVAYIANAIAVDNLVTAIASLERERDGVRSDNERLRGELLRLMSVERVTALAGSRLGLVSPERPPVALSQTPGVPAAAPTKQESNARDEESAGR